MDLSTLLNPEIENRFLRACFSYHKLLKITDSYIRSENFSTRIKAKIWDSLIFYWKQFEDVPSEDIFKVVIFETYDKDTAKVVTAMYSTIAAIPLPEFSWILHKIDDYVKTINMQKAIFNSASLLKEGKVKEVETYLIKAVRDSGIHSMAIGNDLAIDSKKIKDIVHKDSSFNFPTRVYALDKRIHGLYRKELFVVMAPMNVGKSWMMVHLTTSALISAKHVLYLTLEMSKDRVMQRVFQNIAGAYSPANADDFKKKGSIWDVDFSGRQEGVDVFSLHNTGIIEEKLNILKRFNGCLSIREYSSATCSVEDVEKEILLYDSNFSKMPDVVIVDALLDMKHSNNNDSNKLRLSLANATARLRRLASDYNCSVCVSHHSNRQSMSSDIVEEKHVGESLDVLRVADTGISLSQNKEENMLKKMKLNIMRVRNQEKWGLIELYQDLATGQFCLYSEAVKKNK